MIYTGVEAAIIVFKKSLVGKDGKPTAEMTTRPIFRITIGSWIRVRTVDSDYGMPVRIMADPKRYKNYIVASLQPYEDNPLPFDILIPVAWFINGDDIKEKADFKLWNRIFAGKI